MVKKKLYEKPEILRIYLDNSISLQMQSVPPGDPPPRPSGSKGADPFSSPFGDKSFN